MSKKLILPIGILAGAILLGALYWVSRSSVNPPPTPPPTEQTDETASVRAMVEAFGQTLKNVSLSAPTGTAAASIEQNYASFVSPQLLETWKNDPPHAPGRLTSSPWPERIEILRIQKITDARYDVSGNVIELTSQEVTSGGVAAKRSISLTVEKLDGTWRITEMTLEPSEPTTPPVTKKTFTAEGISIAYPSDWTAETGEGLGGANLDHSVVKIALPETAFKDEATNYVEAYLVVSTSTTTKSCLTFTDVQNVSSPDTQSLSLNGILFKTQSSVGVAAGNIYDSQLYRAMRKNACTEIALVVHTGNIGNYPAGTVTAFDTQKAFTLLQSGLETFAFVD